MKKYFHTEWLGKSTISTVQSLSVKEDSHDTAAGMLGVVLDQDWSTMTPTCNL